MDFLCSETGVGCLLFEWDRAHQEPALPGMIAGIGRGNFVESVKAVVFEDVLEQLANGTMMEEVELEHPKETNDYWKT